MKFAILIYDDVEPIDLGGTAGVLSMARRFEAGIEIVCVAENAGEVRFAGGVRAIADYGYDTCPDFDVLIVTGGPGWIRQAESPATLEFVQRASRRATVASVCTGAMILAAAGLTDGRAVTTRRRSGPGETAPLRLLADRAPAARPREALLVDTGDIVTGGGVTLAIDVTFHLLERFFGTELRERTAALMEYDRALAANARHLEAVREDSAARPGAA